MTGAPARRRAPGRCRSRRSPARRSGERATGHDTELESQTTKARSRGARSSPAVRYNRDDVVMPPIARGAPAPMDRLLRPVHRWVWRDFDRRVRKLLAFGEVESDGGRDILRAAELTPDPLLRRLYLEHALDELRHGHMFRERGAAIMRTRPFRSKVLFGGNPLPG